MEYLLVGIGGAFGGVARYAMGKLITAHSKTKIPLGTLIINITGAFLLGILSALKVNPNLYLVLGEGFLGAYTTFSTFMYEGFTLFNDRKKT